jgi:hypothetical protein
VNSTVLLDLWPSIDTWTAIGVWLTFFTLLVAIRALKIAEKSFEATNSSLSLSKKSFDSFFTTSNFASTYPCMNNSEARLKPGKGFSFSSGLSIGLGSNLLRVCRRAPAKKALALSLFFWKSLLPFFEATLTRAPNPFVSCFSGLCFMSLLADQN